MSVFILILWTPIQYSLNEEHIALSLLIILTSMSIGLFNISFQEFLVLKSYTKLMIMQVQEGFQLYFYR